jgi:hypothetical protein
MTRNDTFENFIVFLDEQIIPKTCPDYLVSNGTHFYLFNSRMTIDGIKNPMKFPSKTEALKYLKKIKCPNNIPFVDLVQHKKIEDVSVPLNRTCNKKIAPNLFDLDICGTYGSNDYDSLTSKYLARINKIESNSKIYSNYDLESCMIDKAIEENPKLDDTHFVNYFQQYFDRMNSNIDEKYLYITQ